MPAAFHPRAGRTHVSGGSLKGMRIDIPAQIRATEAKVRLALFNILSGFIEGCRVIDGFSGSGLLGIEALSRGASFVAFIENDLEAVLTIRKNLELLYPEIDRSFWQILHTDVERGLRHLSQKKDRFDLILFDPPYRQDEGKKALNTVVECAILTPAGLVVLEHDRRSPSPMKVGTLQQSAQHRYGDTVLSFYQVPLENSLGLQQGVG
ncbi:MAG: 16S rRNA (guanine(966)-N(2))-methyltransferase RsmD [Candidatus Omnitrophica bacterium]|nr:16S rRNA (guanine(966)-N(2))-methyltransferase RsmD [Candidatus Omnitrophota bacterium]MBI2174767.1 16S rRNA (guanine(966)-N(2))-methyltransferase RsmD [Candidatus Omnitrophota bacterium]